MMALANLSIWLVLILESVFGSFARELTIRLMLAVLLETDAKLVNDWAKRLILASPNEPDTACLRAFRFLAKVPTEDADCVAFLRLFNDVVRRFNPFRF